MSISFRHDRAGGRFAVLGLVVACALATAGAGLTGRQSAVVPASSGVLTIANETGGNWTCGFNPFNLADESLSLGPVYEPLAFVNTLRIAQATPWLAESWKWSDRNRTLTFMIRRGVRFSEDTPMTAADVVYTFQLLRRHPALDINAIWSALTSVSRRPPVRSRNSGSWPSWRRSCWRTLLSFP
jgi:peptide/nickel transport system substrate-binding protein